MNERKAAKKAQKAEDQRIAKETQIRNIINYNRVVAMELANRAKEKKPNPGSFICLQNVNKIYDNLVQAVFDFSLDVKKNEFIVLVGPSGCGKSTTLRMIAGLEEITAGNLFIDNTYANVLPPKDRDIAMVFQSYALYPHMSVYNNMAFAMQIRPYYIPRVDEAGNPVMGYDKLEIEKYASIKQKLSKELYNVQSYGHVGEGTQKVIDELTSSIASVDEKLNAAQTTEVQLKELRKYNKNEIEDYVLEAAKILQIEDYLNRKPRELSGGQRQRVALGRAIVKKSKLFLMDEPLSNLDAKLRVSMRSEIKRIHKSIGATTIYVTHDQTEAMTMADRIVIMNKGYIQQIGTPQEIYTKPANIFVATFIGSPAMNIFEATLVGENVIFKDGTKLKVPASFVKDVKAAYQDKINKINEFASVGLEEERQKQIIVNKETIILNMKTHKAKKKEISEIDPLENIVLTEEEEQICQDIFNKKLEESFAKKEQYEQMIKSNNYSVKFGIRPENVFVEGASLENDVVASELKSIKISISELLGNEYYLHGDFGGKDFILKSTSSHPVNEGETTNIIFDLNKAHLFDSIDDIIIF